MRKIFKIPLKLLRLSSSNLWLTFTDALRLEPAAPAQPAASHAANAGSTNGSSYIVSPATERRHHHHIAGRTPTCLPG